MNCYLLRLGNDLPAPQETSRLLQEAVLMTLDAVKNDLIILSNPKVSVVVEPPHTSDLGEKNTVEFEYRKNDKK